jgi:hypothetical protein
MKKYLLIIMMVISNAAFATVDCDNLTVNGIQSQSTNLLINVKTSNGNAWKSLGIHGDVTTQSFQAIAQQALAMNMRIIMRFPDGHICSADDFNSVPFMIRITR